MKCRRDNRAIVQRYKWIVSVVIYVRDGKYSSSNKARIGISGVWNGFFMTASA